MLSHNAACCHPLLFQRELNLSIMKWFLFQFRTRLCNNPEPNVFGKMCEGSSKETGICNEFTCGNISPYTYNLIRQDLRSQYYNVRVKEGDVISFESPLNLINRINNESPSSEVKWTFDRKPMDFSKKNKYSVTDKLVVTIQNVTQHDNGEYICVVTSNTNVRTPIRVIALAVEPSDEKLVFNSARITLPCKSTLPAIYIDLLTKWYLNGTLYAETDIATIDSPSSLTILQAFPNHSGEWICVLEQYSLGLKWTTNIYKVYVIEKPSFLDNLYYPSIILFNGVTSVYVYSVFIILLIMSILLVAFGAMCYLLLKKGRITRKSKSKHVIRPDLKSSDEPELVKLLNIVESRRSRKSRINVFRRDGELVNLTEEDELKQFDDIIKNE